MNHEIQPIAGLSAQEIREIEALFPHYPDRQAVSIEALRIVQTHRGWVSDAALPAVAGLLGVSAAQLEGVATFYNLIYRQPVGKTVIHYCDSVTCWMLGAETVREQLCRRLNVEEGGTTADGLYTLLPAACLGACDHAPVVMVDGRLLLDINSEALANGILGDYS